MIYLPIFPNSLFRNSKFVSCSTDLIYTYSTGIELLFLYLQSLTYFKQVEGICSVCLVCLAAHCMDASNYWWPGWYLLVSRLPWTTANHLRGRRQWCSLLRTRSGRAAPCWKIPTRNAHFMAELWCSCWSSAVYFCFLSEQVLMGPVSSRWFCSVNGSQLCLGVAGNQRPGDPEDWLIWCVIRGDQSNRW